jgi:NAD-dependent SIR2 family protein deacetylase
MNFALFTGAGASKAFQFPLTSEFLPSIVARLKKGVLFGKGAKAAKEHQILQTLIFSIYPGLEALSAKEWPLVTDLLSIIDHSLVSNNAVGLGISRRNLIHARRLLEAAVYEALDWAEGWEDDAPPAGLTRLSRWLNSLHRTGHCAALITTNYDTALDCALFEDLTYQAITRRIDFGVEWRDDRTGKLYARPLKPALSLLKLHGSINMLRCPNCDQVYINMDGDIAYLGFQRTESAMGNGWNQCHCDYAPLEPTLVAPSSVRDIRDPILLNIWRNALEALRRAHHWILVGYSFPAEDLAIRSIFSRAYVGRSKPPSVTIVQLGRDLPTIARYLSMFPEARYEDRGVDAFIDQLKTFSIYRRTLPRLKSILAGLP